MAPDRELENYRTLIEPAQEFRSGFGWTTVAGILFCGIVMMPGGIYLSLMTGNNIGVAAQWVTVILFMEIARRALQPLSKQQLVVLLHAAWVIMAAQVMYPGGPAADMVYRAYLVGSEAVRDAGMLGAFPKWFAPAHDSPAITARNLFHPAWLGPAAIALALMLISLVTKYTLGYFFFRLTSDVERLPFPLAPINAQGATALAEADGGGEADAPGIHGGEPSAERRGRTERWRIFSLGAYIGLAFGLVQVGIPAITSLFLAKPLFLLPQPFVDTTTLTEKILPATPTGMAVDAGVLMLGFVLPFWSVIGSFCAIALTVITNPLLHHAGLLSTWQPGMNTVNTTFSNNIDFWLSFGIGAGIGIAVVSVYSTIRDIRRRLRANRASAAGGSAGRDLWKPPREGRGDYPIWIAIALYVVASIALVALTGWLLCWQTSVMFFMAFFVFIYNPFISYVNARLLGIAGQNIVIPNVKEIAFLLSGAKGVEIWLAPVPVENFAYQAQAYRVNELTGVNFWSLVKADLVALPVLFVLSFTFWGFIWKTNPIPSDMFPATQINWELAAKNQVLLFSSTFTGPGAQGERVRFADTELGKAIKPKVMAAGGLGIAGLFIILTGFGLPTMLVYGLVRGFGNLPHYMLLEIVGALLGKFVLRKRFGEKRFLQLAPALLAGYMTGVGLIGMAAIAMRLITTAVSTTPF